MDTRTLICSSRERADACRRRLADEGAGWGIQTQTAHSFVEAQWELWGDGRALVTPLQRRALMRAIVSRQDRLASTPGTVDAIASFVAYASGTDELRKALDGGSPTDVCDDTQRCVLDIVARYQSTLHDRGLVECGEAAALLDERAVVPILSIEDPLFAIPALERLFKHLSGTSAVSEVVDVALPPGVSCRFLQPTGPAASMSAMARALDRLLTQDACQSVVICSSDPECAYAALRPFLYARGCTCELSTTQPFARTWLGRALACMRSLVEGAADAREAAIDAAYDPWFGLAPWQAEQLDREIRADRAMDAGALLVQLRALSDAVEPMEAIVRGDADLDGAIAVLASRAGAFPQGAAWAAGEVVAATAMQDTAAALGAIDALDAAWLDDLSETAVARACTTVHPASRCRVLFSDHATISAQAPGTFDAVIIDDVSDAVLHAAASCACSEELARRIGCEVADRVLDELRTSFKAILAAARAHIVCLLPATNDDRERAYPSFVFEELLSCLVGRTVDADDAPAAMAEVDPSFQRVAEDDVVACVGQELAPVERILRAPIAQRGHLEDLAVLDYLWCVSEPGADRVPVLSPSAVERYLHCPYAWFLQNRVAGPSLDEGFGPAEKGSFAHAVIARFYGMVPADEVRDLDDVRARALIDAAFDEVLAEQADDPHRALMPLTPSEHAEMAALREQLHRFSSRLRRLPVGYRVFGHEVPICPEDGLFAGIRLNGRADRVDVDDAQRRFAVIDYKGSIAGHAADALGDDPADPMEVPEKVQALVYAQALRSKMPGYHPVAALYASYSSADDAGSVAGSYDMASYDVAAFAAPGCETGPLEPFLDEAERRIALHMERLCAGDIAPVGRSRRECQYCPYDACEVRA